VDLTRRSLIKAGGLTAATLTGGTAFAAQERRLAPIVLTGTAFGTGNYQYHPFQVPAGVARVDVSIRKQGAAATGLGIFDPRGSHYATLERPNGFRGSTARSVPSSSWRPTRHRRPSVPDPSRRASGPSSCRSSRRGSPPRTRSPCSSPVGRGASRSG